MPAKTISSEIFINHLRDTLQNPDNKICFILGAGASVESGIVSGGMLARQWYKELPKFHSEQKIADWKTEVAFEEENIPALYSKLFRFRYDGHREDGIHLITSIIENGNPGFGYTILSQVLQRTLHNVVITTNFDTLTEESLFIFTDKRALVCSHENIAHLARPSNTRPLIVKIHRSLYMDPLNDQDEISEMKLEWKIALTDIFRNYIPIVIGYGGNDGSLMNYLREIEPCQRMYWCLNSSRPPRADIIEVVERHRGSFVTIGGFNRLMFRFIDLFGLTKTHEVMEQLAHERAEKLRSEFEEAAKDIGMTGTTEEKHELRKVAEDFDTTDWLQWLLKAAAADDEREMVAIYQKALVTLPQSPQLRGNFGYLLDHLGDYDGAIAAFRKAIELNPENTNIWYNLGNAFFHKGEYERSIYAYNNAIEKNPKNALAYYNMGNAYSAKGDYDGAIEAYRNAIKILPTYQDAWDNMGITYHIKGDYNKAIIAYRKATEIKPDDDGTWYNMGNTYLDKGEHGKAKKCYDTAISLNPQNEKYKNALKSLELR